MSLELWSTIASVGTFVVITTTAIAAVVQLYHLRSSNQIAILNDFRKVSEDVEFRDAVEFLRDLPEKAEDSEFRRQLMTSPLMPPLYPIYRIGRLYETLGLYVKRGILDADTVCDLWAPVVLGAWEDMADVIVVMRRTRGITAFENFEYLALLCRRYVELHASAYPSGEPRIAPADRWAAQDGVTPPTPTRS